MSLYYYCILLLNISLRNLIYGTLFFMFFVKKKKKKNKENL